MSSAPCSPISMYRRKGSARTLCRLPKLLRTTIGCRFGLKFNAPSLKQSAGLNNRSMQSSKKLWRHLRILIDRQDYWSFDGMRSNTISNGRDSTAQWIDTAGFWSRTKTSSKDEHPQLTYHEYLYGLAMRQASLGRGARSNRARSWSRSRKLIEALHEPGHGRRVGLADAVDVGADQDQAAGAALAVGGGEAGLGAADLAGEGGALAALGLLERLFLRREFLLEGRLPSQQLLKFVLWLHPDRR